MDFCSIFTIARVIMGSVKKRGEKYEICNKYRRSRVPTQILSSRRISKLCNLSRVKAESENLRIVVELLDLELKIESNTESNIELLA